MLRTGAVQENYRRQPASGVRVFYNAHGHPALLTTIAVQLQALQLQLAIGERLPTLIPYLPAGLCVTRPCAAIAEDARYIKTTKLASRGTEGRAVALSMLARTVAAVCGCDGALVAPITSWETRSTPGRATSAGSITAVQVMRHDWSALVC